MTIADDTQRRTAVAAPAGTGRLFAAGPDADLAAHARAYGPLDPIRAGAGLIGEAERAGLTGRGGAAFPAHRKLASARAAGASRRGRPVVIANGAEGEPRSRKDATLLRHSPHLVLDGLLCAGAAVGAGELVVYSAPAGVAAIRRALSERADCAAVRVVEASDTFISGEAGAVVSAIQGGPARPADRVVRLSEEGYRRRPTLVHSVETLAHLALIARFGADWFRSAGSVDDPGTRLVTVSGAVSREGVLEVAGDTPIRDILDSAGCRAPAGSAVLVGGFHGAWITDPALCLSPRSLAPYGAHPGAGVLYVLAPDECALAATAGIADYLAGQSAGQCGPCRFGLPEVAGLFARIAAGRFEPGLVTRVEELGESVVGRGSCHHPDGTARLVASALRVFSGDVRAHASGRCLRAGADGGAR